MDNNILAYIIGIAAFITLENLVMTKTGAKFHVSLKDWTFFVIVIPFYGVVIAAPVEYAMLGTKPAIYNWLAGGALFLLGTIIRMKAHLDLGKSFSVFLRNKDNQKIVKVGLYRSIRHPMYLAMILLMIGCSLFLALKLTWIFTLLGIIGILVRIPREEASLIEQDRDYRDYIRKTSALIPGIY